MAEHSGPVDAQRQALLEHLIAYGVQGVLIGGAAIQSYRPAYAPTTSTSPRPATRTTSAGSPPR